ncbi:hypothetical protein GCM10022244_58010 [Streptomyces gulbargensis]|uniref:Uncharacterized protein n=1 Tax=Streptomyces gulbargensis TaxID=364901 RepID=A0ABP7NC70_9ACTN
MKAADDGVTVGHAVLLHEGNGWAAMVGGPPPHSPDSPRLAITADQMDVNHTATTAGPAPRARTDRTPEE